ncbi:disease resistance (CC-NBS-LRR class) family protein, partial [Trifolium pratense]
METHIVEAEKKTEEIETSVGKCVNDAENLRREVDDLVQRKETDMKAMGKFEGNTHQPYSRLDSLPGIQYQAASEDFIYFGSRQQAYDELFKALND